MEDLRKSVRNLDEDKIRRLSLEIDRASSASRSQYTRLERQIRDMKKKIAARPAPAPVVEHRPPPRAVSAPPPPEPEPEPRVTAPSTPGGRFHVVQGGDTLGEIAKKHNLSLQKIMGLNPKVDPRRLQIGQKIRLR
jgi:hypothetical protein